MVDFISSKEETILSFDSALEKVIREHSHGVYDSFQRTLRGPLSPNSETYFNLKKFRKFEDLRSLAVISWYLEEGLGALLRLDLEEKSKLFKNLEQKEEFLLLLTSKANALEVLFYSYHPRAFFGNYLRRIQEITKRLRFLSRQPQRARETVRRRGYRDHGSCRPEDQKHRDDPDWSFTEMMNLKEERDEYLSKVSSLIAKYGCLAVRLSKLEVPLNRQP